MNPEVTNLFEDVKDGLTILRMLDKISPGIVSWPKVNQNPTNKFKKVENCNYAIVLAKQLKFSLVGIGGSDFVDGNRKLTLCTCHPAVTPFVCWRLLSDADRYRLILFACV